MFGKHGVFERFKEMLILNIISNLQKFLMEMGKGYAFVARQQYIHTEKQDYTSGCRTDGYVCSYV